MAIVRRWNAKRFTLNNVDQVGDVLGVYMLMTDAGYVNYVGSSRNLRTALQRHLDRGDIPAYEFTAFQTSSFEEARRLEARYVSEYEPYYNEVG